MSQEKKIVRLRLEQKVLNLFEEGKTDEQIAEVLSKELEGEETISQPTVSRWLKPIRQLRKQLSANIVFEHINEGLLNDAAKLSKIETQMLNDALPQEGNDPRARAEIGERLIKLIFKKWEILGIKPEEVTRKFELTGENGEPIRTKGESVISPGPGLQGLVERLVSSGIAGPARDGKAED